MLRALRLAKYGECMEQRFGAARAGMDEGTPPASAELRAELGALRIKALKAREVHAILGSCHVRKLPHEEAAT